MSSKKAPNPIGLPPEKLRWRCDPASVPFASTKDAPIVEGELGQDRALRALQMGVELTAPAGSRFRAAKPTPSRKKWNPESNSSAAASRKFSKANRSSAKKPASSSASPSAKKN